MTKNFAKTRHTCYYTYLAMSSVFSLPPLLFVTFREMYGISYTLLGTLVLVNFCTQLIIDLVFSFFSKLFNIHKTVKLMPLITSIGLVIYALVPHFAQDFAYLGLVIGTVVFSVAAGLCEVLMSPLVAALPSDNPERDMSMLHSLYAYGVLMVVVLSTIFLKVFGKTNWVILTLLWAVLPLISVWLFCTSPLPNMDMSHGSENKNSPRIGKGMILCVICIFLGGASENTMTNWISGYMEKALEVSKLTGDILGMAAFAMVLGLTRSAYAKYGKNIMKVLQWGMAGAVVCYFVAGLCTNAILCMVACVFTGICTSMLWPGTLILMEEKYPGMGVTAYALMAAGGDLGGSVAPQALGIVVDKVSASPLADTLSKTLMLTTEQIGMKAGMLTASIFPIMGMILLLYMKNYFAKESKLRCSKK